MRLNYLIPSNILNKELEHKRKYFLGHWCSTYNQEKKDFFKGDIVKHRWRIRKNFVKDYNDIQKVYEITLINLTNILNEYFKKDYSVRFWRILIGTWLNTFVSIYYEKNFLINKIKNKKNLLFFKYNYNLFNFIAKDYSHFNKISTTDEWQYYFFLELIKEKEKDIKFIYKKKNYSIKKPKIIDIQFKNPVSNFLGKTTNKFFGKLKKKQKIIFFDTWLGKSTNLSLYFKNFHFFPAFYDLNFKGLPLNFEKRNSLIKKIKAKTNFQKILLKLAILNLPKNYLEDFKLINKHLEKLNLPKNPKIILTSNGLYMNSIKSRYVSECVEKGTKLLIIQHGGNYGNFKQNFFENHEISISNHFLSWGWGNKDKKKLINIGTIVNFDSIKRDLKNLKHDKKFLLFVVVANRRFIKSLQSISGTEQNHNYYYKFCPNFISSFTSKIKKNLVVRTYDTGLIPGKPDLGWNLKPFLRKKFKNIKISGKRGEFYPLVNKSKVVVCTILSTVFFECLLANIPTILVLPFSNEVFNKETENYIRKLEKANIYFRNYKDASKFLNLNWETIDIWWKDKNTQNSKDIFLNKYSKLNKNYKSDLQNILNKAS